jgi:ribosomal protein L32
MIKELFRIFSNYWKCPACGYYAFDGFQCWDCGYRRERDDDY